MSGLLKSVGKVFKKVGRFVKKNWKWIVIAAAVYFTAGVALSYFGSTAAFASGMPGFGAGGMLSKAAVAIGFQGSAGVASGLSMTSGVWAGATTAAMGSTMTAAEIAAAQSITGAGVTTAGAAGPAGAVTSNVGTGGTLGSTVSGVGGAEAVGNVSTGVTSAIIEGGSQTVAPALSATDAFMKTMATASKLQMASTLVQTAAGLFGDSEDDINRKEHDRQWGNAFGVGRDGNSQYGWATQGGSDAFKSMSIPPSNQGSNWASQGGDSFLNSPYNAKTSVESKPAPNMDGGQQMNFLDAPQQGMA